MVKVEDHSDNDCSSQDELLYRTNAKRLRLKLSLSADPLLVKEENLPRSSSCHLRSCFIGMGFSSILVDKVIEENGTDNENLLLQALINYSNVRGSSNSTAEKISDLSNMDFSKEEINLAIANLGENAPLTELVDFIITSQTSGPSGKKGMNGSLDCGKGKNEVTASTLFGTTDKSLSLLQMGFAENEVSTAIEKYGPDVPISELADSIFASRMASTADEEELEDLWDDTPDATRGNRKRPESSSSNAYMHEQNDEDIKTIKKAKQESADNDWETTYETKPNQSHEAHRSTKGRMIKEEEMLALKTPKFRPNINGVLSRPPHVFYANLIDIRQGTWKKLSQFLYTIEPEFVSSQSFSALIRKEGYLHNLPTDGRFHIVPKPPTTIGDALPHTKKYWPSWDTRKQINCISHETTGVVQLCERLGKMMSDSHGLISREQQIDIIQQCKRMNLIWVGPDKLRPIEPEQVEAILGYPREHTEIWGMEPSDRLKALQHCFQTDTLGYHLSVLKSMYPNGLRVVSVFSGIGGAEIALHRLGIHLKCVVSVEPSEVNRKILKRWWMNTSQTGVLKQVTDEKKLTIQALESLVSEFGGFDIVIGSNPGDPIRGSNNLISDDMDMNPYYEFVRVFQRVRSIMGGAR